MKNIRLFFIAALIFISGTTFAQVEKYMAAFTYQICKATTWPNESPEFRIGIVGTSPISQYFKQMSKAKKMGDKPIKFIQWENVNEITSCQALFIPQTAMEQWGQIQKKLENKPVLIFTNDAGVAKKDVTISFEIIDNKIRYNLNKSDLTERKLRIQSTIERMALKVY